MTAPEDRKETPRRLKLAVWKFASCDGCQLSLLDCEDELLTVAEVVEIALFKEATRAESPPPYDLSLVEGSISTPEDAVRIRRARRDSKVLVTIGACATAGGIQALRNFRDAKAVAVAVYPRPDWLEILEHSRPVSDFVRVDFELRGCPVDKRQLLDSIAALLRGCKPRFPADSVCAECKRRGVVCLAAARGVPCLGPVTHAGCGALCPSFNRGCYGCFGPKETANVASLSRWWTDTTGLDADRLRQLFQGFNAWAQPFRQAADPAAGRSRKEPS